MKNSKLSCSFFISNFLLGRKKKLYKKNNLKRINCVFWKKKKYFSNFLFFLSKIKPLHLQLFLIQEEFLFLHIFMVLFCFNLEFQWNRNSDVIKNNIKILGKKFFPIQIISLVAKKFKTKSFSILNISCVAFFFRKTHMIMQKNINFSFDTFMYSIFSSQKRYHTTNYANRYITML
nr:hypothetical protein CparaKRNrm3_p029 [Cryptomonas paramecium]